MNRRCASRAAVLRKANGRGTKRKTYYRSGAARASAESIGGGPRVHFRFLGSPLNLAPNLNLNLIALLNSD